jgi:hypothetical protein
MRVNAVNDQPCSGPPPDSFFGLLALTINIARLLRRKALRDPCGEAEIRCNRCGYLLAKGHSSLRRMRRAARIQGVGG